MNLLDLLQDLASAEATWQDSALCAQADPEVWFPEKGGNNVAAKAICDSCEVQDQCLEYAMEHDLRWGIYGGLSDKERQRMRAAERAESGEKPRKVDAAVRDAQISALEAPGVPAWQIAEQVGVSERTVVRSRQRRLADAA